MKRLIPVIVFLILAAASWHYGYTRTVPNPDPNHMHADFAVWIDGQQLDFSDEKYMTEELTANQLQALENSTATGSSLQVLKQYLHLHDGNGHVIHRHKPGLTIGDFFSTLPWGVPGTKRYVDHQFLIADDRTDDAFVTVRLFVNGKENSEGSAYVFQDGDQLLITDATTDEEVQHELSLMTDEACMFSKTCPSRGKPPVENCISDPTIPCIAP